MKTRTIVACIVVALAVIFCFSLAACSSDKSKTTSSEEEVKQFISEDFGASLISVLALGGSPMDEFYLLEPIHINTIKKIKNPNIIIPVADKNGYIHYSYVIGYVNGYVSSISSQNTPLWNEVLKYDSENVILFQDDYKVYAQVQDKVFLQKYDGSVEILSDDQIDELRNRFKKVNLVSTSFKKSDEYTMAAEESYRNLKSKKQG